MIYFIQDQKSKLIKIGYSAEPQKRLQSISTDGPKPLDLELLAVMPGDFDTEVKLHEQFSKEHEHGEWFRQSEKLKELIGSLAPLNAEDIYNIERLQHYRTFSPARLVPTNNDWDLPILDIELQAKSIDTPIISWGRRSRRRKIELGTIHFYCDEYKFSALWKDPSTILKRRPLNVVEPSFGTDNQLPLPLGLSKIYRKRFLAHWWQTQGLRVFVDLQVADKFREINLAGIPQGWKAYATRAYGDRLGDLQIDYEQACDKAQSECLNMLVIGGGEGARRFCQDHCLAWIHEGIGTKRICDYRS